MGDKLSALAIKTDGRGLISVDSITEASLSCMLNNNNWPLIDYIST